MVIHFFFNLNQTTFYILKASTTKYDVLIFIFLLFVYLKHLKFIISFLIILNYI